MNFLNSVYTYRTILTALYFVEKQRVKPFIIRKEKTSIRPNTFASGKPPSRCFVPHLGGLNMISSDKSSILTAWTEYRFKKQIFGFKILIKPRDFAVKHYLNIYMTIIIFFEIHDLYFQIDIFIFLFWNKNFKRIGCAKAGLLYVDRVEIIFD